MQHYKHYHSIQNKYNLSVTKLKSCSFLIEEVAKRMVERLNYIKSIPQNIIDLGSGLNIDSDFLHSIFPKATIYQIDFAINMLKHNKLKLNFFTGLFYKNNSKICANVVKLPIRNVSIDLAWANMLNNYIHQNDLSIYFLEIKRVLKSSGYFLMTMLGANTLEQLREVGLNTFNFPDMHVIGDLLIKADFYDIVTDVEYIKLEYDDPMQLLSDIRLIGCGAVLSSNYLGKAQYINLENKLNALKQNDKISLTLELITLHGWSNNNIINTNNIIPIRNLGR